MLLIESGLRIRTDKKAKDCLNRFTKAKAALFLFNNEKKIYNVTKKLINHEPESFLVIDATTGQNAISQVKAFKETTPITGLVLTKLDGTAKGGVVVGIVNENKIPVKFIGVGEQIDDMEIFNAHDFIDALFE